MDDFIGLVACARFMFGGMNTCSVGQGGEAGRALDTVGRWDKMGGADRKLSA